MVDGGVSGRRGGNAGDAARKQQMAVDKDIFYAVEKILRNKADMDPTGMEERDDLG